MIVKAKRNLKVNLIDLKSYQLLLVKKLRNEATQTNHQKSTNQT